MFIKTDWQTSLPKTGDHTVSVLVSKGYLFTGSNGFVYKLDPALGSIVATNTLPDRGNHDVRFAMATDGLTLYVGTAGYVLALDSDKLTTKWQTSLPDTGDNLVNLVFHQGVLYAGSHGFVYKLDASGRVTAKNTLPERGNHQVKLVLDPDQSLLYVGTDGYALGLSSTELVTKWQTSLPETGDNDVDVLFWNGFLYTGSNGFVYKLDPSGRIVQKNTLPDRGRHRVNLAMSSSGTELFVGTDGYALGLVPDTLQTVWQTSLPETGHSDVNLLVSDLYLYAGSDGRLFELDVKGTIVAENPLPDRGAHEVRLAIAPDQSHLYFGTDGYAIGTSEFGAASIDRSCWMEKLGDKIKAKELHRVCLPGTHDSATYGISSVSPFSPDQSPLLNLIYTLGLSAFLVKHVFANWAKAQGDNITQQLRAGVRYLDLRVCRRNHDDDLWICHGMYSVTVDEVIKAVKDFLSSHPKEIVLLDFNHFYEMTPASHAVLVKKLKDSLGSLMAPYELGTSVTVGTLWDNRRQVIVFYDDDKSVLANPELWSQMAISSPWPNVTSVDELHRKLSWELPNTLSRFFVLQGVLTPDKEVIAKGLIPFSSYPDSLLSQADQVNPRLATWIRDEWSDKNLNIVIADWYDRSTLVDILLLINERPAT